jgi:effector-binding domain-containing protein
MAAPVEVEIVEVEPCVLAAARGQADRTNLSTLIFELLDRAWTHVRATDLVPGHNVVAYFGDPGDAGGAPVEIGVQVDRRFEGESADGVRAIVLPGGPAARALHRGHYDGLHATNLAILDHCRNAGIVLAGPSWEVYGDWHDDPAQLETEVFFLLGG